MCCVSHKGVAIKEEVSQCSMLPSEKLPQREHLVRERDQLICIESQRRHKDDE